MKHAVVTGCAGFIGSHLSERLLAEGWRVLGIDAFTSYYERSAKEANLRELLRDEHFDLVELDLAEGDLSRLFQPGGVVFHLAAQPGVRSSFGEGFAHYVHDNILATQRVLEAGAAARSRRVVWASSSSVYGDAAAYPCFENGTPTCPRSPYGATKRACEDLAEIYRQGGLSAVGLRYFTVYGPRQRPDMAMRRLCEAVVSGSEFPLYGDGLQSRDFTHVSDAVDATYRAALAADPAPIYNVGGGHEATMLDVIELLGELDGSAVLLDRREAQVGDVRRTGADTDLARGDLGWRPSTGLREGLLSELEWVRIRVAATALYRNGRGRKVRRGATLINATGAGRYGGSRPPGAV